MMKVPSSWLAVSLAAWIGTGCSYVPTRSLEYDPVGVETPGSPWAVLAVRDLTEARPPRHYSSQFGHLFKTYIPLVPYVKIPYERLDESDLMSRARTTPEDAGAASSTASFARRIAADLGGSGLFREVRYIGAADGIPEANFVLGGDLRSTEFDVYATSYMLGMAGVLLWLLPLPMGSNAADVRIDLQLSDPLGTELWSHELSGRGDKWFTLYNSGGAAISSRFSLEITRYGGNDEGIDAESLWAYHASAPRSGMEGAKQSLAEFLARQPQSR